jgi:hypothetical protein
MAIISISGDILQRVAIKYPEYISVSPDNVIFVTEQDAGVLQSTDDGITWRPTVSNLRYNWRYVHAIRVVSANNMANT